MVFNMLKPYKLGSKVLWRCAPQNLPPVAMLAT